MTADREHVSECLAFARMALHYRDAEHAAERAERDQAALDAAATRQAARQRRIESRQLIEAS